MSDDLSSPDVAAGDNSNNKSQKTKGEIENPYESSEQLNMYLSLHYPSPASSQTSALGVDAIMPHAGAPTHALHFAQRTARLLCSLCDPNQMGKALDIGCAVGGAAFDLATKFNEVQAFDYSESFIKAAKIMQKDGEMSYSIRIEGDISETTTAILDDNITSEVRNRCHFFQGDACKLKDLVHTRNIGKFDAILMSNLLCRLPDPIACIDGLRYIVNNGGVVLFLTPYTWLEEYTPRCNWIGGHRCPNSGEVIQSRDVLKQLMEDCGFERIHVEQVPLLIREHMRKYQYILSEATGWRKVRD